MRDEVHRFGITFHRNQRSRHTFQNELEKISGIGRETATRLLSHFKSVKKIKSQPIEALAKIVGRHKAGIVHEYFSEPAGAEKMSERS
ncbi:MAG TPA: helix-hairpin-helix domain-containing protein [Ginsengibacter sp.]|nr:helix-hairpin-helix domain-containing protein [Ginsengibacter sp.]